MKRSQRVWLAILELAPGIVSGIVRPKDWDALLAGLSGEAEVAG